MRKNVKDCFSDLYYEARIQAVIHYYALVKKELIDKPQARKIQLTDEQYMEVRNFRFHVLFPAI